MIRVFLFILIAVLSSAVRADNPYNMLKYGWQIFYQSHYESITTCSRDEGFELGSYLILCEGSEYPYHYGEILLLTRALRLDNGKQFSTYSLCLMDDDDTECIDVNVYERVRLNYTQRLCFYLDGECRDDVEVYKDLNAFH